MNESLDVFFIGYFILLTNLLVTKNFIQFFVFFEKRVG